MLLFLDIDGVMVPAKSWARPDLSDDGFAVFSPKAVGMLQDIISDDTTVMLTTSHKSRFSSDEWKSIFQRRGINVAKLERLVENTQGLNRKDEILNWFDAHYNDERFLIIDDDKSLNGLPEFLKNHLVLTSSLVGLTNHHREEINAVMSRAVD